MAPPSHPTLVLRDAQATVATCGLGATTIAAATAAAVTGYWVLAAVLAALTIGVLRHLPPTTCRIDLDGIEFRWPLRRVRLDARTLAVPLRSSPAVTALKIRPRRGRPFAVVLDTWSTPLILRAALSTRFEHAVPGTTRPSTGTRAARPLAQRTS